VEPRELLPRRETVAVAALIVVVAVLLRSGYALLQGSSLDLAETVVFALVFAVFYFGALQFLGSSEDGQQR